MSRFRPIDRSTDYLLLPSVQEWLPESHLARYGGCCRRAGPVGTGTLFHCRGSDAYHSAALLPSLLIYGYATGTHSSRKIESGHLRPCRRFGSSPATGIRTTTPWPLSRRRFGKEFAAIFIQVLQVARENQLSRFGTVSLTAPPRANASSATAPCRMDTPRRSKPSSRPRCRKC